MTRDRWDTTGVHMAAAGVICHLMVAFFSPMPFSNIWINRNIYLEFSSRATFSIVDNHKNHLINHD